MERNLFDEVRRAAEREAKNLDDFKFREALKDAMEIARAGNKYLADAEPWKLYKTDPERTATILNAAVQVCANIVVAFEPFLPFMAEKLRGMLHLAPLSWDMLGREDLVPAGEVLEKPELLFEKIGDEVVEAQLAKLAEAKRQNLLNTWQPDPVKKNIPFETFESVDIRVGTVLECEKVKKADKLLRFLIDDGMEKRTIVSGIAKYYTPDELIGKQVCFIANFEPRKLKGIVSEGMILSAVAPDGRLIVIGPTGEIAPGATVG